MALRLRRGTDAERLTITPVEGELVYTTDTKLLYVGDGTTAGGVLVTGSGGGGALGDLSDVTVGGPVAGEVLKYDGAGWVNDSVSVGAIASINDIGNVDTSGVTTADALIYDGANWVPGIRLAALSDDTTPELGGNLDALGNDILTVGTLTGNSIDVLSVSGDSGTFTNLSSTNITSDGVLNAELVVAEEFNGRLQGDIINDSSTVVYNSLTNNLTINDIEANNVTLNGNLDALGNDILTVGTLTGNSIDVLSVSGDSGTFTNLSSTNITSDGVLNAELVVAEEFNGRLQGDIVNNASSLVYNSLTDDLTVNNIEANNVTAELVVAEEFNGRLQGDIVNNSSSLVYNSFTNNLTINDIDANIVTANTIEVGNLEATTSITTPLLLDTARQIRVGNAQFPHTLVITNDSGGADDYISVFTDTNTSSRSWGLELNVSRTSVDTPTTLGAFDLLSGISWRGYDGTEYQPAASIYTYTLASPIVPAGATESVIPTGMIFSTNDSSGTERVLVFSEGALTVPSTVTAPSFVGDITGSLFFDDSTPFIDATDGSLQLGNVNIVGQTGNIPLDSGAVDSWLEVQVNGITKYIPLYD